MAKKSLKPKELSDADKAVYDTMPLDVQQFVNKIANPAAKSAYIQQWASQETVATPTPTTGGVSGTLPPFAPNVAPATTDQIFYQRALGTEAGRRVDPMGVPIAGSASRILGTPTSPMQELRGTPRTAYLPRYYEDSADLINSFGYEKIAQIQNGLKKAGLLGDKYAPGRVDKATREAWIDLLEQANRIPDSEGKTSVDWQTALEIASTNPPVGKAKLQPKVSNPADIANIVRQVSRNVLGRGVDPELMNEIVQAFQRNEVRAQTGQLAVKDGARVEPPGLEALAERKIRKAAGPEADAYRFAQFAERIFGAAGSGAGVGEMGMP